MKLCRGSASRLLPVALAFSLAACGNGTTDEVNPSVNLASVAALQGTLQQGTKLAEVAAAGDDGANEELRGFFGFDLSQVPAGVDVLAATLVVDQWDVVGNPYGGLGPLPLDHVNIGETLEADDFDAGVLAEGLGVLSQTPDIGARVLDVTAQVLADLEAGRPYSSFRVRFTNPTDGNDQEDQARFFDASDPTNPNKLPRLNVSYAP